MRQRLAAPPGNRPLAPSFLSRPTATPCRPAQHSSVRPRPAPTLAPQSSRRRWTQTRMPEAVGAAKERQTRCPGTSWRSTNNRHPLPPPQHLCTNHALHSGVPMACASNPHLRVSVLRRSWYIGVDGDRNRIHLTYDSVAPPAPLPLDHMNANSSGRAANGTRAESGRQSSHLMSNDTNASGPTTKCSSKHTKNTNKNSSGKNLANDDDFTVPLYYSQEKLTLFPTKSLCKSVPAQYSSTDKRHCIS